MSARPAAVLHRRSRPREEQAPAVVSSNVLVAIVNARGVIDASGVPALARELDSAVDAGATKLIVDLTQAEEVTTACMNALLAVRQRLAGSGGRIAIALPAWISRRFQTLGLGRRFLLVESRSDAARLLGLVESTPRAGAPAPRHAHAA
jgi:anti-anti-sigma regulatory factor